jgi:hypothetical protein
VTTNKVFYRADKRGNQVELVEISINSLTAFQWGRDVVTRNVVSAQGYMNCTNSNCTYTSNVVTQLGFIVDVTKKIEAGSVLRNTIENQGSLAIFYNRGKIADNVIKDNGSSIGFIGATKLIDSLAEIQSNVLTGGGQISYDSLSGSTVISRNTIENGGTLTLNTIIGTEISTCNIGYSGLQITASTNGSKVTNCSFQNASSVLIANLTTIINGKTISNGFSNFETSLDMSDVAIYDLASKTSNPEYDCECVYTEHQKIFFKIIHMIDNHIKCNE